jgi:hypothetical protein
MIAFQWTDKDKGACEVQGLNETYSIRVRHDLIFDNTEPASFYYKHFGDRAESTHIGLLPRHIQERVALLQLVPAYESVEGVGIRIRFGLYYICEEE